MPQTMFRKLFVSITLLFTIGLCKAGAQDLQQQLALMEDSLVTTADSMYNAFLPDERTIYNEQFVKQLVRALKIKRSYEYPFTRLQQKINIISPDDKAFRIFNWAIAPTDITRRYYGAIQMPGEDLKLYPLIDHASGLGKISEDSVLTNGRWFGALYYRIIPHEWEGKTVYTLFGLNASSPISNKKIMDPLLVTPTGPVFGAPVFNVRSKSGDNGRINRFIMEYKKEVQASLNWDNDLNAVYFDKLVSQVNDPNRKYTFVPSGEYDGFKWENEHWNYVQNLIPVEIRKDGEAPTPSPVKPKE